MDALQKAIRKIQSDPAIRPLRLCSLIKSLDDGQQFDLAQLYRLNYADFGLALELMKEWRLDSFRYERGWASKIASEPMSPVEFPSWSDAGRRLS
jgi:hypothetical protein